MIASRRPVHGRRMDKALNALTHAMPSPPSSSEPQWLHLVPAGTFTGADGRGPYVVKDAAAVIAASNGRKLPIDENHAIDLVGSKGGSSPARGWIVEMQARADGIWGRVEWTKAGREIVDDRAYGFLSPVFMHSTETPHRVAQLVRVALTNDPNLQTLTALHSKKESEMEEELRKALGLDEKADQAAIVAAVKSAHSASVAHAALMGKLSEAAGTTKDAKVDDVVTALQAKLTSSTPATGDVEKKDQTIAELNGTVTSLQSQLTRLATSTAKDKAEVAIGAAITAGKLVPALRDHMITRHMKNPAEVETELAAMPSIHSGSLKNHRSEPKDGELSGSDADVCAMMGLDPKAFGETAKTLERSAV